MWSRLGAGNQRARGLWPNVKEMSRGGRGNPTEAGILGPWQAGVLAASSWFSQEGKASGAGREDGNHTKERSLGDPSFKGFWNFHLEYKDQD